MSRSGLAARAAQLTVVMGLTASGSSGCGLYDRSLLDPAPGTHVDANTEEQSDLTRKPGLSYVAAAPADAGTGGGAERKPGAADTKQPVATAAAGRTAQDAAADGDAGMQPTPTPPKLEMRQACGDRPGYVRRETGNCYIPLTEELTWYRARDLCSQRKSHLVSITQPAEQAFVASLPRTAPTWIGLSKFGTASYGWVTGEATSFTAWEQDAPSSRSEGGAVLSEGTGAWSDAPPSEMHRGLCERDARE